MVIAKQAFVSWLAIRDSLSTGVKILKWGYKCELFVLIVEAVLKIETFSSFNVVSVRESGRSLRLVCVGTVSGMVTCRLVIR
jgi:hypothetical protein